MANSFAPSGTLGSAITAAAPVVATIGPFVVVTCETGTMPCTGTALLLLVSSESANPTGTTTAATRATKRRIRTRFRITVTLHFKWYATALRSDEDRACRTIELPRRANAHV